MHRSAIIKIMSDDGGELRSPVADVTLKPSSEADIRIHFNKHAKIKLAAEFDPCQRENPFYYYERSGKDGHIASSGMCDEVIDGNCYSPALSKFANVSC